MNRSSSYEISSLFSGLASCIDSVFNLSESKSSVLKTLFILFWNSSFLIAGEPEYANWVVVTIGELVFNAEKSDFLFFFFEKFCF